MELQLILITEEGEISRRELKDATRTRFRLVSETEKPLSGEIKYVMYNRGVNFAAVSPVRTNEEELLVAQFSVECGCRLLCVIGPQLEDLE